MIAFTALLGSLVLASASASADTSFGEQESPQAGYLLSPNGIAVDNGAGSSVADVYVGDGSLASVRVDKFGPGGNSLFAFGWGVADGSQAEQTCTLTCTHIARLEPETVEGGILATARGVAADPSSGDLYVEDPTYRRIEKFDEEGNLLFSLGGDVVAQGPDDSTSDEQDRLTVKAEGGTFKLEFVWSWSEASETTLPHARTAALPYDATAAEVEAALDSLSTINGVGGSVSVNRTEKSAVEFEYEITFEGALGGDDLRPLEPIDEEGSPPHPTLTGASHTARVETIQDGGGPEVCKLSSGDKCKEGGLRGSGINGTFSSWPEGLSGSIAVDQAGTLYVGDENRVQKFDPEGVYSGQVNVPGGGKTKAVAVDSAGDLYVISENVAGVQEFEPSGALLRTLSPPGAPGLLATDGSGDVFVGSELERGEPTVAYEFFEYDPTGALIAQFTSPLIKRAERNLYHFFVMGMAVGYSGQELYVTHDQLGSSFFSEPTVRHVVAIPLPSAGPPEVSEEHATDIEPTTATLRALVNPREFDTHYAFQYITEAAWKADGESFGAGTQEEPSPAADLGSIWRHDAVSAAISPLTPATSYRFRVKAESTLGGGETVYGPAERLQTLPAVSIRHLTTQTVGPELVALKGELSPNNGTATEYEICFGEEAGAYTRCSSGTLHVLGNEFETVTATFGSLNPNTEYHYQASAINSYGEEVKTPDQVFTTELSDSEERAVEDCPQNGAVHGEARSPLREENNSATLPDCRAYEQVSPSFKNGHTMGAGDWVAPSGERVLSQSVGAFAGAIQDTPPFPTQYLMQRTEAGWVTRAVVGNPAGEGFVPSVATEFSPELDRWIFPEFPALSSGNESGGGIFEATSGTLYQGRSEGTFAAASPVIQPVERTHHRFMETHGASNDTSDILIETSTRDLPPPTDPRPSIDLGSPDRLYEVAGAGGPNPEMRLVAEVPTGLSIQNNDGCALNFENEFRARRISADGSVVIYSLPIEVEAGKGCGPYGPNPIGLFATVNGSPIRLDVASPSQCSPSSPCATAPHSAVPRMVGMNPAGSRVWFTTPEPLIDADTDQSTDVYVAKIENGQLGELVEASAGEATGGHPSPGAGADVLGVSEISRSGATVAFVATAVLTAEANAAGDTATEGADNLYAYDLESGKTKFVERLCSGPSRSRTAVDGECPSVFPNRAPFDDRGLWEGESPDQARFTPDGRFLVFGSVGRLSPGDTDTAEDLYRYDLASGELIRVSFGRNGNDGNGNDDEFQALLPVRESGGGGVANLEEDFGRAVSTDGSKVIFRTPAPLVSADTNLGANPGCGAQQTGCDIYEWEETGQGTCHEAGGCIGLISDGRDVHGTFGGNVSASGRDVTFYTPRNLVPGDTDGIGDIYDAREGGGFPYVPPAKLPCQEGSAEACHGLATEEQLHVNPVTEGIEHGVEGEEHVKCAKGKVRVRRHGQVRCVKKPHRHHRKRHHGRGARATRRAAK